MNRKHILVATCLVAIFIGFLASPFLIKAQAQTQQQDKPKLFVIFKLKYPEGRQIEDVGQFGTDIFDITSNLKQFLSLPNNNKVEYVLKDSSAGVTDKSIDWQISYKMIDASNPDVIKTKNGQIQTFGVQDYAKDVNTKTNVATYTAKGSLVKDSTDPNEIMNMPTMDMKATIYPNGTGILESKQQ